MTRSRANNRGTRVVRTRRGARILQDDVVLSEILARPGPTDTLFDVLAACGAMLSPGPRMALLGFAGGGVVAPMRGMGFGDPIDAVDLSRDGEAIFRELSEPWAGAVRLYESEASKWLRRKKARYDFILEDLSYPAEDGVTKPEVSYEVMPDLIRNALSRNGVALYNLLDVPGMSWRELYEKVTAPFSRARLITLDDWENRLVLVGDRLDSAWKISRRLRHALNNLGSNQAGAFTVRTLRI